MTIKLYESPSPRPKEWRFKTIEASWGIATCAVDAETGKHIAYLYSLSNEGGLVRHTQARHAFARDGYDSSPLVFNNEGKVQFGYPVGCPNNKVEPAQQ